MLQSSAGGQDRHRGLSCDARMHVLYFASVVLSMAYSMGPQGLFLSRGVDCLRMRLAKTDDIVRSSRTALDHACHVVIIILVMLEVHETRSSPRPNDLRRGLSSLRLGRRYPPTCRVTYARVPAGQRN